MAESISGRLRQHRSAQDFHRFMTSQTDITLVRNAIGLQGARQIFIGR